MIKGVNRQVVEVSHTDSIYFEKVLFFVRPEYYGMSEKIGNISFYDSTGSRGYELTKPYSEKTAELIDKEVKDLIEKIHDRTEKILKDNFEGFTALAELLLEKEVIFADDLERIFGPRAGAPEGEVSPKDPEELAPEPELQTESTE